MLVSQGVCLACGCSVIMWVPKICCAWLAGGLAVGPVISWPVTGVLTLWFFVVRRVPVAFVTPLAAEFGDCWSLGACSA